MTDESQVFDEPIEWNIVVTSREGGQRRLRRALAPALRLRRAAFRNVLVGSVEDVHACLQAVAELCERRPRIRHWLGRILPVERTFAVDPPTFDAQLQTATAPFVDRLAGRSFHVRIERRGHKGVINTHASEQAVGGRLYDTLEARGAAPTIEFADPDVVLAVEVIGDTAGVGLVTRELRQRFPFVKID